MTAISDPILFQWVIIKGNVNILPGTNAPTQNACIQSFLNKMNPLVFPPYTVEGNLVGRVPPQQAWEELADKQDITAARLQVVKTFYVEDADEIVKSE